MNETPESNSPAGSDPLRKAITLEGTQSHLFVRQVVSNRYEILEKLGHGGMGEVWRVYDLKLRVEVALKSVRRTTPDAVETLRREVRTAREVISPNVCRIFDLVVEEAQEFLSMEYIDGQTLIQLLQGKSPLDLGEAREIASQFLAGLEAIHQAGLVHRDLKPENIMITRTGRVVVMDFGIAKPMAQISGTISGTLPYMAPEQLSGGKIDARSDVFAVGVLLAEMLSPIRDHKSRQQVWNAVREDPPKISDNPWQAVIARAVAKYPDDRFASAGALSRALEEVTQRVEIIEERKPYPGLFSFTEGDAEYFFGRELEAETVLTKIQQLHLMAIIGPSGAGKTSFLRAGLIPVLPTGWSHVFTMPGDSPLINLGQALAAELSGDTEAVRKMVRLEDINAAFWLLHRWRQKHPEALLIVDRFEELFTLNNHETQARFAELLGRAVLEADVRLLLVMRDDFLIFCKEHVSLAPIFSELTALLPLSGPALRRALIQPALQCGYRFQDEALVDEILNDVEKERGALPLMSFAAARLWEKRDRKEGLLTREAYRQIGGVAGALAQHAEATMDRIGTERHSIVREIFRNMITAQNTRAARDTQEILSIFEDREAAEKVLHALIDARLLSSFEAPAQEGEKPRRRIEIIHESLLSAWPRLVRWQTQDADSAQLRDQLRQAAQLWEQRNRSQDLLWTGTAFLEFQAWRQRYSGGLSSTEEAFTQAMVSHQTKQRRRRRILLATIFIVLLTVLALISFFWRGAEVAKQNAVSEAQRAEAGKILALGRGHLDTDPTRAVAYALASLELADTPDARRFALQSLWKGPIAMVTELPIGSPLVYVEFSPDGNWLAVGGAQKGGIRILHRDGRQPLEFGSTEYVRMRFPQFLPDSKSIVWRSGNDHTAELWSLSPKKHLRTFRLPGETICLVRTNKVLFITDLTNHPGQHEKWTKTAVHSWPFDKSEPKLIGHWNFHKGPFFIDPTGQFFILARGRKLYTKSIDQIDTSPEVLFGEHDSDIKIIADNLVTPTDLIVTADSSNQVQVWSLKSDSKKPLYTFTEKEPIGGMIYYPSRSIIGIFAENGKSIRLRNLKVPLEAEPLKLLPEASDFVTSANFHPTQPLFAVTNRDSLFLYSLDHTYPYVFRGAGLGGSNNVNFTPDGKSAITSINFEEIQQWQLPDQPLKPLRGLWKIAGEGYIQQIDVDPLSKYVLASTMSQGCYLISIFGPQVPCPNTPNDLCNQFERLPGTLLKDGPGPGPDFAADGRISSYGPVAFSLDGKVAAGAINRGPEEYLGIHIWDLGSKRVRILEKSERKEFFSLKFSPDGSLFSGDTEGNLSQWNLRNNTVKNVGKGNGTLHSIALTKNGRYLIACFLPAEGWGELVKATSELILYDLKNETSQRITSHGNRIYSVAFDPAGTMLVTGDLDGIVRVGPITGESPHLLFGHQNWITEASVSPDGRWIGTTENTNPVMRLWTIPKGPPFQTLPYDEFLKRLRALTNIRVVKDQSSSTGYRVDYGSFPGWEKLPTW